MKLHLPSVSSLHPLESEHPHLVRALRAATAAAIAWLVVLPMGGVADTYDYYAPFGAVVAVSSTVAGSIRGSAQAVGAVLIGAALALLVEPLTGPQVLGLAVVVAAGSLISGWDRLGDMGSWVPIAAMFVLLPGSSDPEAFVIGYLGLTSLGAVIGVLVNLLFAPLPLGRTGAQVREVRDTLAAQLTALAEGLRRDDPPTRDEWDEQHRSLLPLSRRMSQLVGEASEARRANWRARHWQDTADRQYELARALEQLTYLVEDVWRLLATHEVAGAEHIALGSRLRPYAADLLEAMAAVLEGLDSPVASDRSLEGVDHTMGRLVAQIREARGQTGDDLFTAGALVIAVRRALTALVPSDRADELPSRH